ncbi:MAG: hypothetical protein K6T86_15975 [Pirellulales bacterium]|nr:hypothetical protein [Pirellulales bacterium]
MERRAAQATHGWLLAVSLVLTAAWVERPLEMGLLAAFFLAGCPCCAAGCSHCAATTPQQVQVVVSGISNGTCSQCPGLDGTYICTLSGQTGGPPPQVGACLWDLSIPPLCGPTFPFDLVRMSIGTDNMPGQPHYVLVTLRTAAGGSFLIFMRRYASLPNCAALANESLPFWQTDGKCQGAGASCTVTAL